MNNEETEPYTTLPSTAMPTEDAVVEVVKQVTVEVLVHEVVEQMTPPVLTDAVKSKSPKLDPETVSEVPPVGTKLYGLAKDKIGASKLKSEDAADPKIEFNKIAMERDVEVIAGVGETQERDELDIQMLVLQTAPPMEIEAV